MPVSQAASASNFLDNFEILQASIISNYLLVLLFTKQTFNLSRVYYNDRSSFIDVIITPKQKCFSFHIPRLFCVFTENTFESSTFAHTLNDKIIRHLVFVESLRHLPYLEESIISNP